MTKEEIDRLIQSWLEEELAKDAFSRSDISFAEDWTPPGGDVAATATQMLRGEAEDALFKWREAVEHHDWKKAQIQVNALLSRRGIDLPRDGDEYGLLCMGVCIAATDLHGIRVERSLGRWTEIPELPPIFGTGVGATTTREAATAQHRPGPSLSEAIDQFQDEKRRIGNLRPKRFMDFEAALKLLARFVPPKTPVADITKAKVGELRILLTKLPPNFTKRFPGRELDEIAKIAAETNLRALDPSTINQKYLALIDAFFGWCAACGFVNENPASSSRVNTRGSSAGPGRGTFTIDDLNAIYAAPLYRGCMSDGRIYETGSYHIDGHRRWLPLLGLYTGARLGELCQLLVSDVRKIDDVWCVDINLEDGKHVKTRAGQRQVPVHPELESLGFLQFVQSVRSAGQKRIFSEIEPGKGGYLSENPSKWFGRFLKKTLGDEVTRSRRLAFHSYRHTVKDALRAAGIEERIQDALLGHESGHVSSVYGEGYKPPRLLQAISKISFPGLDLSAVRRA